MRKCGGCGNFVTKRTHHNHIHHHVPHTSIQSNSEAFPKRAKLTKNQIMAHRIAFGQISTSTIEVVRSDAEVEYSDTKCEDAALLPEAFYTQELPALPELVRQVFELRKGEVLEMELWKTPKDKAEVRIFAKCQSPCTPLQKSLNDLQASALRVVQAIVKNLETHMFGPKAAQNMRDVLTLIPDDIAYEFDFNESWDSDSAKKELDEAMSKWLNCFLIEDNGKDQPPTVKLNSLPPAVSKDTTRHLVLRGFDDPRNHNNLVMEWSHVRSIGPDMMWRQYRDPLGPVFATCNWAYDPTRPFPTALRDAVICASNGKEEHLKPWADVYIRLVDVVCVAGNFHREDIFRAKLFRV